MPGNIVCGICGAVRYYSFILQAKKFGTFSCEPCRKFISKTLKKCQNEENNSDEELFPCLSGSGECVVPPDVIRGGRSKTASKKSEARCQACWLKLCLIGYKLEDEWYEKLRSRLPIVFHDILPEAGRRGQLEARLLPNRGEILHLSQKVVPLSRPLFDGFGEDPTETEVKEDSNVSSENASKVKQKVFGKLLNHFHVT